MNAGRAKMASVRIIEEFHALNVQTGQRKRPSSAVLVMTLLRGKMSYGGLERPLRLRASTSASAAAASSAADFRSPGLSCPSAPSQLPLMPVESAQRVLLIHAQIQQ